MNPESVPLPESPVLDRTGSPIHSVENLVQNYQALQQENQQLQAGHDQLARERENLHREIEIERLRLETERLRLENARLTAASTAQLSLPKPVWPDKHDGTKSKTRNFVNAFKNAIKYRPEFESDDIKIITFGSLLKDSAADWYTPIVEKPHEFIDILKSFDAFVANFEANFGIPNRDDVAFEKVKFLKQGRLPASTYAATFRSYAVDLVWNEATKIQFFRDGLNSDVRKMLLGKGPFTRLEDLIIAAVEIDQELHRLKGRDQPSRQVNPIPPPISGDANAPVPMDLDALTTRRGPLSAEERDRRVKLGLCFYCGEGGHMRNQCTKVNRRSD